MVGLPSGKSVLLADVCRPGGPRGIVLLSLATGAKRCLTEPASTNADDFGFVISPDGRTVAFLRSTTALMADIYTIPLAGGVPRRLTNEHQTIDALMWTLDGKYITFASNRATQARAWTVPAAGGPVEPEMVYPWVGIDLGSLRGSGGRSLSRDGQRFAFVQFQGGDPPAIWRADLPVPGGRAVNSRKLISPQMYMASAQLSGSAQLSPWRGSIAAHLPAPAERITPLVAGQPVDCLRHASARVWPDLRRRCRGPESPRHHQRRLREPRAQLVRRSISSPSAREAIRSGSMCWATAGRCN